MTAIEDTDGVLAGLWAHLDLEALGPIAGVDWALPALEALAARSTVIFLKLDGEREHHRWTIIVMGGVNRGDVFRRDAESAEAALVFGLRFVAGLTID